MCLALRPEVAVGNLQHIPGGVVEVERPDAVVPFDLLQDRSGLGQALLPVSVFVRPSDEARVDRPPRTVRRGLRLAGREAGVEEKQQAFAHAERQTTTADRAEAEDLAVEV